MNKVPKVAAATKKKQFEVIRAKRAAAIARTASVAHAHELTTLFSGDGACGYAADELAASQHPDRDSNT
jgi:hypothetical protein